MQFRITLFCLLVFVLAPCKVSAQYDRYDAGLYAVVNENVIHLKDAFNPVSTGTGSENILLPISNRNMYKYYDGETSGVNVTGTFVLVAGHDRAVYVNNIDSELTPCSLKIIALTVDRENHCREYQSEDALKIGDVSFINGPGGCDFEWYRIGENSFGIKMTEPKPGEYVFYIGADKTRAYCFTIPENVQENEEFPSSTGIYAQTSETKAGLYAVVDDTRTRLDYSFGGSSTNNGTPSNPTFFRYKGETSSVIASDTFEYVTDPTDNRTFSPFNKWMNPNGLALLKLTVDSQAQSREYTIETNADAYNIDHIAHVDFEWKKTDKNSFLIKVPDLQPGEYGIVVRKGKMGAFDYTRIHCFTVSERLCNFAALEKVDTER